MIVPSWPLLKQSFPYNYVDIALVGMNLTFILLRKPTGTFSAIFLNILVVIKCLSILPFVSLYTEITEAATVTIPPYGEEMKEQESRGSVENADRQEI